MNSSDVRQKYSLFSIGGSEPQRSGTTQGAGSSIEYSAALDRAVALYSSPVLDLLRNRGQMRAQDILRALANSTGAQNIPLPSYEEFLGLLNRLEKLELIRVVERDPFGNHLVTVA